MEQQTDTTQVVDEDAILQEQLETRESTLQSERGVVLRVYNYYRIVISFLLLILFYQVSDQTFVGTLEPIWFQTITRLYLVFNIVIGFLVLMDNKGRSNESSAISIVVILDIFFVSLILLTSGGIESGLSYLLVFSVAFGGVMLGGTSSLLFPAIAAVNSISIELYLQNTGAVESNQHFFAVALLGMSFFVVNLFFQYASGLIKQREREVVSLEVLNRMHSIAEQSRRELEIANDRFNALLKSTGEGVLVVGMQGKVAFANPRASQYLQIEHENLIASDIQEFMLPVTRSEDTGEQRHQKVLELLGIQEQQKYDPNRWQTALHLPFVVDYSCEIIRNKAADITGAVVLFRNITEQRENEEKLQYLANHDELTGLANRTSFKSVVRNTISRSERLNQSLAILIVDTDHFTVINEKMGEEVGDLLLKATADRLTEHVRDGDLVARLHADQFAIMLVDLDQAENSAIAADKINQVMAKPFTINSLTINTSVSIGIAVMSSELQDADELISAALSALEAAKDQGRHTYRFYQANLQHRAEEKKRIQILLRTAADDGEFQMMYQPIVSLKENNIHSSEALIRWRPEKAQPIQPDIFIPVAEESGQIIGIGSWVLQTVSNQVNEWKKILGAYPSIAINVSSKQLRDQEFRKEYEAIVETFNIPADVLEMELTETGVMEDQETSLRELNLLRDLGVKISIDDFGTGYASIDYLRRLPVDLLKIDQSFTNGIGVSDNDEEIVRVMIRMAHAMGLKVICEGVETKQQLEFLQQHECDLVQGYYFSKPKSVDEITELFIAERDGTGNIMQGSA